MPNLTIFHELLIEIGITKAEGAYLHKIFNPLCENSFGFPSLLRVPSGKITADLLFISMYFNSLVFLQKYLTNSPTV